MVYKQFYPLLKRTANRIMAGRSCVFCGLNTEPSSQQESICNVCVDAVKDKNNHCYQCGNAITAYNFAQRCGDCLKTPKPYHRLISACHYDFPINQAISRFKFNRQLHLGKALTNLLLATITDNYKQEPLPELILPIPLHHKRLAERSFNQLQLIAQQISQKMNIPLTNSRLQRVKNTPHQIGLKAIERRKNLKGAFKINRALPKHIALVDDVVTTGTTITEASKICLKHGAQKIDIWCLAKT